MSDEKVDRARLRRLAVRARDDETDPCANVALAPSGVELALALDPATVLALLNDARLRRVDLERLAKDWIARSGELDGAACAIELFEFLRDADAGA